MGVKSYGANNELKYKFQRKAGRSIVDQRPIFSPDGESLLVIVENIVRVYNKQTTVCVRTLETEAEVDQLVGIGFPDDEKYNLYGCSDDGRVTTWTWENGAVLREANIPIPKDYKIVTFNLIDNNTCFITAGASKRTYLFRGIYSIKTGEEIYVVTDQHIKYFKHMTRVAIGWCNGDRFAAVTNGTKKLYIQNLKEHHQKSHIWNNNMIRIIAVAAHHTENTVAIVDARGRSLIYRGNLFEPASLGKELLHWHSLPALAVCFSMQGSYLYTGGLETVLVKWTLGNLATTANEKVFIPRLPGIIRYITTNNTHVAITLANNSIVIANVQMAVESTILECGGLSPAARALATPLIYHKTMDGLIMSGRTGHMQVYSIATDKVLYNIDITGLNNIPPQRFNLIPIQTEITCAAVSANGTWLVTSEYRNDGVTYPEERLKFWLCERKSAQPFKLNTCVNLSHGGCNVVSIALSVRAEFCVTAGADQKFRIWKSEKITERNLNSVAWKCFTACYYSSGVSPYLSHGILNNFKNRTLPNANEEHYPYLTEHKLKSDIVCKLVNIHKENNLLDEKDINSGMRKDQENDMGGVAISEDGSMIAAWFGCKLTLWDTHLCNMRTTLSHPALRPKGIHVKFGNRDAAHYLVCTTEKCLAVWSILSLTVKWLVQLNTTCLAAEPLSNRMAVITTNNDVYVFTPHNSTPIMTHKQLLDPKTGVFKQCTFGSTTKNNIKLFVMRNDSEIYCLEPEKSDQGRLEVISRRNMPASNFSALVAEKQRSEVQPAPTGAVRQIVTDSLCDNAIAQFLSAAPHMVPPVSLFCTSFLQHISGQEPPQTTEDPTMEIDQALSEDEEDTKKLSDAFTPKTTPLWTPNYEKVKEKKLDKIVKAPILDLHTTSDIFGV